MTDCTRPRIWLDLDNSPHVLFFAPLVASLRSAGITVVLTAKPQAQTLELARLHGLDAIPVGRSNARKRLMKAAVTLQRTAALYSVMTRQQTPALFLSHGSRSGVLAARLLGVPAWTFLDYEHVESRSLAIGTTRFWFPDLLRTARLPSRLSTRATFYPGLKENVYLAGWPLRPGALRRQLGVPSDARWVVTRPPATTAHYACEKSWRLWKATVSHILSRGDAIVHAIPRDGTQGQIISNFFSNEPRLSVLKGAVDGPSLIAGADLVLGGGGTMNREAAVLGTPVWSVFNGPTPHIDEQLAREGRLRWIRQEADIATAEHDLWLRPTPRGGGDEGRRLIIHRILEATGVRTGSIHRRRSRRILSSA